MSASKRNKNCRGTKRNADDLDEQLPAVDVKTEREDLIQFPFVELDDVNCPLSTAPVSKMSATCTDACKNSFLEIKAELKSLRKIVEDQTKLVQQLSGAPLITPMEAINNNKNSTMCHSSSSLLSLLPFPLNSDEDLIAIENHINDQNRELYLQKLRRLLNGNVAQNLRKVLSEEIILDYNIDGKQGKKKLREYSEFFDVVLDALNVDEEEMDPPEIALKKALQVQKKRHYRRKCAEKAKSRLKDTDDDDDDDNDNDESE